MFGIKTRINRLRGARRRDKNRAVPPLSPDLWDLSVDPSGCLGIGRFTFTELAEAYGTPLYVVHEVRARNNCRRLVKAFSTLLPSVKVFYSYKTNPVPEMLRIFHEEGVGAEVISDFELWLALALGVPPHRIIFNGLNKTQDALALAVAKGIRIINIDSFGEIEKLQATCAKCGCKADVGIRILTGVGWGSQFGFSIDRGEAMQAVERIQKMDCLRLIGIHFHLGTLLQRPKSYEDALQKAFRLMIQMHDTWGIELSCLDIGGGYGVPTVRPLSQAEQEDAFRYGVQPLPPGDIRRPMPEDYARTIGEAILRHSEKSGLPLPALFLEPGRLLSSSAQTLLLRAGDIKVRPNGERIAILDGGAVNVAYPTMGEYREVFVANRMAETSTHLHKIVGSLCTPGDALYPAKVLPEIRVGDCIAIMDAGAYFVPNANNFSFPRPAIAVVAEQTHWLTRKRETFAQMVSNDTLGLGNRLTGNPCE
jgi:diaminopimelate decarboxylase